MTEKIKELLAVLAAKNPEKKLQGWAWRNDRDLWRHLDGGGYREISNADLAFRLRDEIISADLANETGWWCEASYEVFLYVIGEENERYEVGLDTWFSMYARPIHWIIAALIAKELSKDG